MSFLCSLVFKQCFLEINWLSLRALILLFSIFIEMNPSKASRLTLDNNSSSSTLESNCMNNRRNFQSFLINIEEHSSNLVFIYQSGSTCCRSNIILTFKKNSILKIHIRCDHFSPTYPFMFDGFFV